MASQAGEQKNLKRSLPRDTSENDKKVKKEEELPELDVEAKAEESLTLPTESHSSMDVSVWGSLDPQQDTGNVGLAPALPKADSDSDVDVEEVDEDFEVPDPEGTPPKKQDKKQDTPKPREHRPAKSSMLYRHQKPIIDSDSEDEPEPEGN